jgi:uncharacterized NAD(P)/FAD-binding protein YdhS
MRRRTAIAIIGVGPTGAALATDLLSWLQRRPPDGPVLITLIDPSAELGMGYAFRSDHVLNMRASTMSLRPDHPASFAEWLKDRDASQQSQEGEYSPRSAFGRYVAESLTESIEAADPSVVAVSHWRTVATDVERDGESFRVTGVDGVTKEFSILVLAIGESRYYALSHYIDRPHFIASPWETDQLAELPAESSVAVIGSSLTAVDACIQLLGQRHSGQISCFSRHRGLPKVQGRAESYQPAVIHQGWLNEVSDSGRAEISLRAVAEAVKGELDHCMAGPYEPGVPDPREWFSTQGKFVRLRKPEGEIFSESVEIATRSHTRWYYALDSLSAILPKIWDSIAEPDQRLFIRQHRSIWNEYRHSMPLVNASKLVPAVASGRLLVQRGLRCVLPMLARGRPCWRITAARAGAGRLREQEYDFVIDATGGQTSLAAQRDPLLLACRRRGLVTADVRGGIRVAFDTCQVEDGQGRLAENLYFVGPLTFGTHFYTNSFETNRANASHVAREIADLLDRAGTRPGGRANVPCMLDRGRTAKLSQHARSGTWTGGR